MAHLLGVTYRPGVIHQNVSRLPGMTGYQQVSALPEYYCLVHLLHAAFLPCVPVGQVPAAYCCCRVHRIDT